MDMYVPFVVLSWDLKTALVEKNPRLGRNLS